MMKTFLGLLIAVCLVWAWFTSRTTKGYFQRVGSITAVMLVCVGVAAALLFGWRLVFP